MTTNHTPGTVALLQRCKDLPVKTPGHIAITQGWFIEHCDRLETINAELLAALEFITDCAAAGADGANMDLFIDQARAAIAKAKGE